MSPTVMMVMGIFSLNSIQYFIYCLFFWFNSLVLSKVETRIYIALAGCIVQGLRPLLISSTPKVLYDLQQKINK